jgi:hypothetical protein
MFAHLRPVGTFPKVPTGRGCCSLEPPRPRGDFFQNFSHGVEVAARAARALSKDRWRFGLEALSATRRYFLCARSARSACALKRPLEVRAGSIICDPSVLFMRAQRARSARSARSQKDRWRFGLEASSPTRRYFLMRAANFPSRICAPRQLPCAQKDRWRLGLEASSATRRYFLMKVPTGRRWRMFAHLRPVGTFWKVPTGRRRRMCAHPRPVGTF